MRSSVRILILCLLLICMQAKNLMAAERCLYVNKAGEAKVVSGLKKVPTKYRKSAICKDEAKKSNTKLADPKDIQLSGAKRVEEISTSIGRMQVQWPRSAERLFGRNPLRAVADAARTTSKFINLAGFRSDIRNIKQDWQIVFMDEDLPETQIPSYYVNNCHPGWMVPPAKIYIVAQRVVAGCGGTQKTSKKVADSDLTKLLLHEFGHVIENRLISNQKYYDRLRSEGFASWFEQESAKYASTLNEKAVKAYYRNLAQAAYRQSPNGLNFRGSAYDYAYASSYFLAITERTSVNHLMDIYDEMQDNGDFFAATKKRLGWNRARLQKEVKKYLE